MEGVLRRNSPFPPDLSRTTSRSRRRACGRHGATLSQVFAFGDAVLATANLKLIVGAVPAPVPHSRSGPVVGARPIGMCTAILAGGLSLASRFVGQKLLSISSVDFIGQLGMLGRRKACCGRLAGAWVNSLGLLKPGQRVPYFGFLAGWLLLGRLPRCRASLFFFQLKCLAANPLPAVSARPFRALAFIAVSSSRRSPSRFHVRCHSRVARLG